jgi:hypothetical protein
MGQRFISASSRHGRVAIGGIRRSGAAEWAAVWLGCTRRVTTPGRPFWAKRPELGRRRVEIEGRINGMLKELWAELKDGLQNYFSI